MGHRLNTSKSKRSIRFKTNSSPLPSLTEADEDIITNTDNTEADTFVIETIELDTEEVLASLGLFPNYNVLFREAHGAIFSENGPLPVYTRHYIALLVSLSAIYYNINIQYL